MIARYLIVDWLQFAGAIVLLLTPGSLFYRSKKVRYREISRDWEDHWVRILSHGLHAIDLVRAALGTWLLIESLQAPTDAKGFLRYLPLFLQGTIRIGAVLLQTIIHKHPDQVNAPFTFVIGTLLGGISPLVAMFACALAIPIAMGARAPGAFFVLLGVAHLGIGFWFKGRGAMLSLAFGAAAAMLPFLWSILFHREMMIAYRAKRLEDGHQLDPLRE
jgi:succinate dehydrogenase hydrophobic anchor subunit